MKVAVTGASGLLGSNVVISLLKAGYRVRCVRRPTSCVSHLRGYDLEWVESCLEDERGLVQAFQGMDAVFHCAGKVAVGAQRAEEVTATNVMGTGKLLRAFVAAKVKRLVYVSSVATVGASENGEPVSEHQNWNLDRFGLDEIYARSKRDAERLVMTCAGNGLDIVVVNPTLMLGPMDRSSEMGKMVRAIAQQRLWAVPPGRHNFADVRDVARGLVLALEKGRSGQRYIMGGHNCSYREFADRAAKVAGVRPPRFELPNFLVSGLGKVGNWTESLLGYEMRYNSAKLRRGFADNLIYSSHKAQKELGYHISSLEHAIRDSLRWFDFHGRLETA